MILSGLEIARKVREGKEIIIRPFDEARVGPNSYDLRLNNVLQVYDIAPGGHLDMNREESVSEIIIPPEGLIIYPGKLYLGSTVEYTETHGYVPMLEGRSSVGRLGVSIHVTAGFGDVGFSGNWTLEIYCLHPIRIYPFTRICQIYYHKLEGNYIPYQGKYQFADGVQASRKYRD
ncbi:MAG: dCTP deaminase [Clostridiales bacterium]|jgi:dCTP deaminase|nr:dCTP deaminase [Clostridiales bacterium]